MPNIKSAKKSLKTSAKSQVANKILKSRINTVEAKLDAVLEGKDADARTAVSKEYNSVLDKAVKKGVMKKNTAGRRKSRAAKRIAAA